MCEGSLAAFTSWLLVGEGRLSQEARLSAVLPAAATLCRLAELCEAVGLGKVGQRFTLLSPKLEEFLCLGSGLCHLLKCCLLSGDWTGFSSGLWAPPFSCCPCSATCRHQGSWLTFDSLTPRYPDQRSCCS